MMHTKPTMHMHLLFSVSLCFKNESTVRTLTGKSNSRIFDSTLKLYVIIYNVGALMDNMALISCIQTWHHQGSGGCLTPKYDLLQVTKGIMAKHKLVVRPEHIKSHQDNDTEYSNLP